MDWIPDDVNKWLLWILLSLFSSQATAQETPKLTPVHTKAVYPVYRADVPPGIKNDWEDPAWQKVTPLVITFPMGTPPQFTPQALARVLYDEDYIYVQFKVEDRYVRSVVQRVNGPVSGDACVEFFFCPDTSRPETYFNMEVNAGGTPLLFCVTYPWKKNTNWTVLKFVRYPWPIPCPPWWNRRSPIPSPGASNTRSLLRYWKNIPRSCGRPPGSSGMPTFTRPPIKIQIPTTSPGPG